MKLLISFNAHFVKGALYFAFLSFSYNVHAIDLLQAYELAEQNNSNYAAALKVYQAAKLDLPLAQSARKTGVALTGSGRQNYDSGDGFDGSVDSFQSQVAINLSRELYNAQSDHSVNQASLGVDIAKLQLDLAKETLIDTTVERYLGVLSALDNQKLVQLERAAIEKQLELATQRLEVGLGTKTDQFDAQARFESSNAELIVAQNEVLNAKQALENLMDTVLPDELRTEIRTLDNSKVALNINDSSEWVLASLEQTPAFLIQQKQVNIQQVALDSALDARSPMLNLIAGISASDSSGASSASTGAERRNWNVGVQGEIPLYQGGAIKLRQAKASRTLDAEELALDQVRRDTDRAIRSARRGVHALERQVKARDQAVRASNSALESKVEGFKAGVTTNLDVLDGQRDLFRARRDYLKTSYDLVNAVIDLERSAGRLNEEDIVLVNSWLK